MDQAAKLLDFSQKLDIGLLDNIVMCMYCGEGQQVCHLYYTVSFQQDRHSYSCDIFKNNGSITFS